ncbi:DUF4097 domain-containing protein [Bacillus sp. SM2101]|uniref:DUF4097 family beta strand repeat-containing protein n=1 Tax=Bacillus sp. SM2101 TaxID=2805366 RepID=UPI001BDEC30E|nr:DUF4097 domain-containing protein [Bacillus sp. SM2101]
MVEDRKRILKMVEEGKLSPDEALTLLEALDDQKEKGKAEQEVITDLSTDIDYENAQQRPYSHETKQASTKEKLIDFMNTAVKKVKNLDLDFNFGPSVDVHHIFQNSNVFIDKVDLDVYNGSVELIPWNENDVRIECEAKVYKVENNEEARRVFLQDVLFSTDNSLMRFAVQKKQMKVHTKIYIPEKDYSQIRIRVFNGPVISTGFKVKDYKAKTSNGSVTLERMHVDEMEIETTNGAVDVFDSYSRNCEAEVVNGGINVRGSFERVDLQSVTGSIKCKINNEKAHTVFAKTTTGSIDITVPDGLTMEGDLKSSVGKVKCYVPNINIIEEKDEIVQKILRFTVNDKATEPLHLFADSKSGSVHVTTHSND